MRILMHDNAASNRGTTRALLSYAQILKSLGHDVTVAYDATNPQNDKQVEREINGSYSCLRYQDFAAIRREAWAFDMAYLIKSGAKDGRDFPGIPNVVHAVFRSRDPHGARYLYVSEWLAEEARAHAMGLRGRLDGTRQRYWSAQANGCMNALDFESLPHVADIPVPDLDLRSQLGIPPDAFVIVRHGGYDTFDIPWVHACVDSLLRHRSDVYFLGMNTRPFLNHPRARFLPASTTRRDVANVLATGDIFLHARREGETFGLAIVEALQAGLPVFAWNGGGDRNHVHLLRDLGYLYRGRRSLTDHLRRIIESGVDPLQRKNSVARGNLFRPAALRPLVQERLTGVAS
jgi:glycosyltransferase involved in cell wall biosynthesis